MLRIQMVDLKVVISDVNITPIRSRVQWKRSKTIKVGQNDRLNPVRALLGL
jgi:hypothetical protein